ncbi:unnamed protein product [Amoebophrya sp. A120]|nr:unnamed protein product [Amoebophrya sp. A120]|eukprot:GSA120T00012140001.1
MVHPASKHGRRSNQLFSRTVSTSTALVFLATTTTQDRLVPLVQGFDVKKILQHQSTTTVASARGRVKTSASTADDDEQEIGQSVIQVLDDAEEKKPASALHLQPAALQLTGAETTEADVPFATFAAPAAVVDETTSNYHQNGVELRGDDAAEELNYEHELAYYIPTDFLEKQGSSSSTTQDNNFGKVGETSTTDAPPILDATASAGAGEEEKHRKGNLQNKGKKNFIAGNAAASGSVATSNDATSDEDEVVRVGRPKTMASKGEKFITHKDSIIFGFLTDSILDILILIADLMCLFAFYSVYRCVVSRGAKGVSIQSFTAFAMARVLHSSAHVLQVHYQPTSLPYLLYFAVDMCNVVVGMRASYELWTKSNYGDFDGDICGSWLLQCFTPKKWHHTNFVKHGGLFVMSLILGLAWSCFRYDDDARSRGFLMFAACSCCEIIQLLACLPQLYILHVERRIPALLGDFLMLQGAAKLSLFTFWLLFPVTHGWTPSNWLVATGTEFFNILILLDFMIFYLRTTFFGLAKGGSGGAGSRGNNNPKGNSVMVLDHDMMI